METAPSNFLKNAGRLLKKISKARRAKNRRYLVRRSEAIERNEAYEPFSAACQSCPKFRRFP